MTATSSTSPPPSTAPSADASAAPHRGGAEFMRIAVAGSRSRADLAVPATLPLARLLPTLLMHAGEEQDNEGGVRHGGWIACRIDGARLDPALGLGKQGVREGDVIFLRHGDTEAPEPLYDDVVEVITQSTGGVGWGSSATRAVSAAFAAVALLTCCGALAVSSGALAGALGLGIGVLVLAVAVLMSRAFGDMPAGTFAGVLAAPPAALGAVLLLGGHSLGAGHLLLACVVLAVVGVVGPLLVGGGDGTFTVLVVVGVLASVGAVICAIWEAEPAQAASVAGPLALALTTATPTLALRIARAPAPYVAGSAEDLEELPSQLEHHTLKNRIVRARQLLIGMVTGCHLVVCGAAVVLFADGQVWPAVLGGILIVLMLLRARLFKDPAQAVVPIATALVAAAGAMTFTVLRAEGDAVPLLAVVVPGALVVALIAGLVALFSGRQKMNPRASRALDMVETLILVTVIPFILAVWGVYGALLNFKV